MVKISNEVKVGFFVAVSLATLIIGYKFMKGKNVFSNNKVYCALYERVDGLIESNAVVLYGHRVGLVEEVELIPSSEKNIYPKKNIYVRFRVDPSVKIPKGSSAKVVNTDILGGKALKLELIDNKTILKNGDTLVGSNELSIEESITEILSPLSDKANHLVSTLNNIIAGLDTFLNKEGGKRDIGKTVKDLQKSFHNIEQTTHQLNEFISAETDRLHNVLTYAENIAKIIDNNKHQIDNFIKGLSTFSDSIVSSEIKSTISEANTALTNFNSVLDRINAGEGSMGMLINNDSLYHNLANASNNLDKLMFDFKANPRRYVHFSVFGRNKEKKKKDK